MREFKFIRGIYKDESIFNIDETNKSLFALYKNGEFISFNTKNDDGFQNYIANLQPEDREIYTLRSTQFKASANKTSDGPYSFEFEVYGNVYDNSTEFPKKVKESAKNHIELKTSAEITNEYPNLNLGNNNAVTEVNFTYRGEKIVSFIKRLIFKVSGFLKEIKYKAATGEDTSAYKTNENKIIIYGEPTIGTFSDGKRYDPAPSYEKKVVSHSLRIDEKTYTDGDVLPIANIYTVDTSKGYTLYIGESSVAINNIPYEDGLQLTLRKEAAAGTFDKFEYTVADRDENTIVKSYKDSYQDFYIVKGDKLANLEEDDLKGNSISVYTESSYTVIGNGAYIESDDDTYYVMLEGNWDESVEITEHNAKADKELISPKITTDTFRQIRMETLEITATEV